MAQLDYAAALRLIKGAGTAVVCGHVNPDGDALGSVLATTHVLRSLGIRTTPLLATKERSPRYDFLAGYGDLKPACKYRGKPDLFVAVDVPTTQRLGDGARVLARASTSLVIDHHLGDHGFADVELVDAKAAAAGMLVWDLAEVCGVERTAGFATCCYTALVTDTGRFSFQNADARALAAASDMARAGADTAFVASMVYQRASMASLKLKSRVIDHMELVCGGRCVLSWISEADFTECGAAKDDGESLVDVIRQLKGIEVAVMLREQTPIVRGSIRSKTDIDVSGIAASLGGGGHAAAAGFTVRDTLEAARAQVMALLEESLPASRAGGRADDDSENRLADRAGTARSGQDDR